MGRPSRHDSTDTRLLPHDRDAEQAVLAACLLAPLFRPRIVAALRPDRFYVPAHALVFDAIAAIVARMEPVDMVTLTAELRNRNQLNMIGGPQFIGELTDRQPAIPNWEAHVAIVLEHAQRRDLLEQAFAVQQWAMDREAKPGDVVALAMQRLLALQAQTGGGNYRTFQEVAAEGYEDVARHYEGKATGDVPYGFIDLDKATAGGAHNAQVIVIAGRPGSGKSSFAQCVAVNMVRKEVVAARAAQRCPRAVLFVSQEMKGRDLGIRQMAADTGIDQTTIRTGAVDMGQMDQFVRMVNDFQDVPLFVIDHGNAQVPEIRATALELKARYGVLAVVVDYLQIVKATLRHDNRTDAVGEVSRGLKQLAMELDVPLLELSQLNRVCETRPDKRPNLADLRSSGEIENDADVVFLVFRPEMYAKEVTGYSGQEYVNKAEIIIAKQRNGPCTSVTLGFRKETTKFYDLTTADGATAPDAKNVPEADPPPVEEEAPPVADGFAEAEEDFPF